jgi:putative ABC transport system ATP-binding protein
MTNDFKQIPAIMLEARGLGKTYRSARGPLTVLSGIDFSLGAGESLAIVGPSGSGKTTLLGLLAGLDTASEGQVLAAGVDLGALDEDGRAAFRRREVGFVFQTFQLLPTLTALENVMVPLELRGERGAQARAAELLGRVGLGERLDHYPVQLSGGEQQRVALARAFIHKPRLLFADEPTGNLDSATGARLVELLFELNQAHGTTLILVTHDLDLAERAARRLRLRAGRLEA